MPIEAIALQMQDVPLSECPKCHAEPFTPFLRGEIQRSWCSRAGFEALLRGQPLDYCAIICADCKKIVGWERPRDLAELMEKYERQEMVKEMVKEWEKRKD